jgi:hypothetical protein
MGYGLLWFDEFSHVELEGHSHPQYFPKVVIEAPRPMTLAAASEEPRAFGRAGCSEDELVLMSSAEGAGLSTNLPPNGSDLADLLVHRQILLI